MANDNPDCETVTLAAGQFYHFHGRGIGSFILKGGSCGKFSLRNEGGETSNVVVKYQNGIAVFPSSKSLSGGVITIQDNPKGNGTSAVIFSKFGKMGQEVINVQAHTDQLKNFNLNAIQLTGPRQFVVNGSTEDTGLDCNASGIVTVNGDTGRLNQSGENGEIRVKGSVNGNVVQNGKGCRLIIDGNVKGNIKLEGPSKIEVKGNLDGNIESGGGADIRVAGKHHGAIIRSRRQTILVGA